MATGFIWGRHWSARHSWAHRIYISSAMSALTAVLLTIGACTPNHSSENAKPGTTSHLPIILTAFDMDRVSAAGVSVEMDSFALVSGEFGQTDTDVITGVVALGPKQIGYGFGTGEAVACCGDDSEVLLDMTASGTGDYVFADTHTVYGSDGVTKFGISQGIVLALSGPSREELVAATKGYISQLALAPPSTYQPNTDLIASQATK